MFERSGFERSAGELFVAYCVPLIFHPQPEGGYTVTSPLLPELLTEGDTLAEAAENASDALAAVVEIYAELGRRLPDFAVS